MQGDGTSHSPFFDEIYDLGFTSVFGEMIKQIFCLKESIKHSQTSTYCETLVGFWYNLQILQIVLYWQRYIPTEETSCKIKCFKKLILFSHLEYSECQSSVNLYILKCGMTKNIHQTTSYPEMILKVDYNQRNKELF